MYKKISKSESISRSRLTKTIVTNEYRVSKMTVIRPLTNVGDETVRWRHHSSSDEPLESWSEEIGASNAEQSTEHWEFLESALYGESDDIPSGPLLWECDQWRHQTQLLRIKGKQLVKDDLDKEKEAKKEDATPEVIINGDNNSGGNTEEVEEKKQEEEIAQQEQKPTENNISTKNRQSQPFSLSARGRQEKERLLDHLVDYVCSEIAEIEETNLELIESKLQNDLTDCLKISPAPVSNVKNSLEISGGRFSDSNTKNLEKEDEENLPSTRHKLGTVFNEKILVSSVPYVYSTKESFSTVLRTPIHFFPEYHPFNNNNNHLESISSGYNTKWKSPSVRRVSNVPTPHVETWSSSPGPQWSKNVKLAPIDTSRLPSSKRRPTKTAGPSTCAQRRQNRNSLSPITRRSSCLPKAPRSCELENSANNEGLEIRGSHIETQKRPPTRHPQTHASSSSQIQIESSENNKEE